MPGLGRQNNIYINDCFLHFIGNWCFLVCIYVYLYKIKGRFLMLIFLNTRSVSIYNSLTFHNEPLSSFFLPIIPLDDTALLMK